MSFVCCKAVDVIPVDDKGIKEKLPPDAVRNKISAEFPGAISNLRLLSRVRKALDKYGKEKQTLLATSFCCDEVNRELDKDFSSVYGSNFSMGGLSGFAFGGVTSFTAMAHHIPDNGWCMVVYGPHVGIDSDGEVGKMNRRGRTGSGACCGSAADASAFVCKEDPTEANVDDLLDCQQNMVRNELLPYKAFLKKSVKLESDLPQALFDGQDRLMKNIVFQAGSEVPAGGFIVLLGGIQINTPGECSDYFLPKVFEMRNRDGKVVSEMLQMVKF